MVGRAVVLVGVDGRTGSLVGTVLADVTERLFWTVAAGDFLVVNGEVVVTSNCVVVTGAAVEGVAGNMLGGGRVGTTVSGLALD